MNTFVRSLFFMAALIFSTVIARAEEPRNVYSTDFWEIAGPPTKQTWVEIHNGKQAQATGIAHVSVLARKKGAPAWDLEWVCAHIAITTDALQRSVLRPFKTRGAYPERYDEALRRWQEEDKNGRAAICSTSIAQWLKEHP